MSKNKSVFWIAIGCGLLVVGAIAFVGFLGGVIYFSMSRATPVQEALQRARTDPRVTASLGTPIEMGIFFSGSIETNNRSGKCDLAVPIKGPKQSATIDVVGTKEGGRWTYKTMVVRPKSGEPIDLLEENSPQEAPTP